MCVHAQSTYTCTIRWVHVPQWCCLATVWRSVFLLWAPDNDFGQNVLFHSKSSPVYIKKRGQEKSPLLSSVWAGNSCLTQFHQRVIKRPMRGDRGYVCTFHSDRSTPPLAAFEQNCPNSLSCSIFGTVLLPRTVSFISSVLGTEGHMSLELLLGMFLKAGWLWETQNQSSDWPGRTIIVVTDTVQPQCFPHDERSLMVVVNAPVSVISWWEVQQLPCS